MNAQTLTAALAAQRFNQFADEGRLIQGNWHAEKDGRKLACALGAIDPSIDSPEECPAKVMPAWLAACVPQLFDSGPLADAIQWGRELMAELARLDGKVPESVASDWMCEYVLPEARAALCGEWIEKIGPVIDEVIAAIRSGDAERIRKAMAAADAAADAAAYAAADAAAYAAAADAAAYAAADAAADAADAAAAAAADAAAYAAAAAARWAAAADARMRGGLVTLLRAVPGENDPQFV